MKSNRLSMLSFIVLISLAVVFIVSVLIIALTPKTRGEVVPEIALQNSQSNKTVNQTQNQTTQNQVEQSNKMLAPFIDMVSWVNQDSVYSINGVPNLGQIYNEIGCENYFLGFIRPDDSNPLESDGTIRWGWGGFYKLSEKGNEGYQYEGIKKSIANVREKGGDVVVSVGGQLGKAPWTITQNITKLRDMYLEIIDAYDLKTIDLDIEEINQGYEQNVANAKAIKRVQDKTGVDVTLTIPIMPYGYTSTQKNLLRAYIGNGVNIKLINNMTMCYGSEVNPGEDFAEASIRATNNSAIQVQSIYKEYGLDLSLDKVYEMLGATVDIGYENEYNPVFTADLTKKFAEFAGEKNLGMLSYWSLNRDTLMQPNKGINTQYEHFEASKAYL